MINLFNTEDDFKKDLIFLDEYWRIMGVKQDTCDIRRNKHFDSLNYFLQRNFNCNVIVEDKIPCEFRPEGRGKQWDLHIPSAKIAIEYKTITAKSIARCKYLRIEEALGSSIDLRLKNPDYKLGYLMVFAFDTTGSHEEEKGILIEAFEKMVDKSFYDFFCPLETNGQGNHRELSGRFTFAHFIDSIDKSTPS